MRFWRLVFKCPHCGMVGAWWWQWWAGISPGTAWRCLERCLAGTHLFLIFYTHHQLSPPLPSLNISSPSYSPHLFSVPSSLFSFIPFYVLSEVVLQSLPSCFTYSTGIFLVIGPSSFPVYYMYSQRQSPPASFFVLPKVWRWSELKFKAILNGYFCA